MYQNLRFQISINLYFVTLLQFELATKWLHDLTLESDKVQKQTTKDLLDIYVDNTDYCHNVQTMRPIEITLCLVHILASADDDLECLKDEYEEFFTDVLKQNLENGNRESIGVDNDNTEVSTTDNRIQEFFEQELCLDCVWFV